MDTVPSLAWPGPSGRTSMEKSSPRLGVGRGIPYHARFLEAQVSIILLANRRQAPLWGVGQSIATRLEDCFSRDQERVTTGFLKMSPDRNRPGGFLWSS